MKQLNRETTSILQKRPVKVLQFGKGNFLRGFTDWMIDLLNEKTDFNGDIKMVESSSNQISEYIRRQEGLYYLRLEGIEDDKQVQKTRLITAVQGVINPTEEKHSFLAEALNPALQIIISNTTEAGIQYKKTDLLTLPQTFPGQLTSLLYHRFKQGSEEVQEAPLHILPCELIDKNGEALRKCVLQYVQLWELGDNFSRWLEDKISFHNTLVDRIVTGYPKDSIEEIHKEIGFEDNLFVKAEPFHLWAIEGKGDIEEVLPLHKIGLNVIFTEDVTPYKITKVRILNGTHTAMVCMGYLKGLRTVGEVMKDPEMSNYVKDMIFEEIIPTINAPKEALLAFAQATLERFKNPFVEHQLASIALNTISKYKARILPTVLDYHKIHQRLPKRLVTALAFIIVFYKGDWKGELNPINDDPEIVSFFKHAWQEKPSSVVNKTLSNKDLWGIDLMNITGLEDYVIDEVNSILD